MDNRTGEGNSEQPCPLDTPQTSVSKNMAPANCLIPVCQLGLSTTVNVVEDLRKQSARQDGEVYIPHTIYCTRSSVVKTDILSSPDLGALGV